MQPTIKHNLAQNGIEVTFPQKPDADTLTGLKALGFRWSGGQGLWYARYTDERWDSLTELLRDMIVGNPVAGDNPARAPRQRVAAGPSLPFLQHINAWSKRQELLDDYSAVISQSNITIDIFIDDEGNVILKSVLTEKYGDSDKGRELYYRITKSGTIAELTPNEFKYGATEVYRFGPGFYGVPDKRYPGVYRPADKEGTEKYLSNGKQSEANKRQIESLGLTVVKYSGFSLGFRVTPTSAQPVKLTPGDSNAWQPLTLPARIAVPPQWRKPYYDLTTFSESYADRLKLRRDLVRVEILLGKMEVTRWQRFDSMTDGYDMLDEAWFIPASVPRLARHESVYPAKDGRIRWGDYYLRYTGKSVPAIVNLAGKMAAADTDMGSPAISAATVSPSVLAEKFFKTATSLQTSSDQKKKELERALRNTPKRNREWNSKNIDADIAADKALYYRVVGQAIAAGTLPGSLSKISPTLKDDDLHWFVAMRDTKGGYYDAFRAQDPLFRVIPPRPEWMKPKGFSSLADVERAYTDLLALANASGNSPQANSEARKRQEKLNNLVDAWRFAKEPGFFPTPPNMARQMIQRANIKPGNTILEPSAGLGDIAEIIREMYPANPLTVCERMFGLREILELKGFTLTPETDFLRVKTTYHRIIMNPPFENGQDIDHVRHAYSLLKPGGWLVAIMGEGAFYRNDKKAVEFRDWLSEIGGLDEKQPDGSFKSAFRPTGVAVRMVMIDKAGIERRADKEKIADCRRASNTKTTARANRQVGQASRQKRAVVAAPSTSAFDLQLQLEMEMLDLLNL